MGIAWHHDSWVELWPAWVMNILVLVWLKSCCCGSQSVTITLSGTLSSGPVTHFHSTFCLNFPNVSKNIEVSWLLSWDWNTNIHVMLRKIVGLVATTNLWWTNQCSKGYDYNPKLLGFIWLHELDHTVRYCCFRLTLAIQHSNVNIIWEGWSKPISNMIMAKA